MHERTQPYQLLGPLWGFATVQLPRDLPGLQHLMRTAEFLGREATASSASPACKAPFSDFLSLITQATSRTTTPPRPPTVALFLLGSQPNTAGTQLSFSNLALYLKHRVTNQGKESDISSGTFPESGNTLCSRDQLTRRPCRE